MDLTGTAYGAPAYERLAEAVTAAKGDDPLAPVTVLVPSNLAGIQARRRLAAGVGGRRGVAGIAVLTVDRLAERIASPALAGSGRRPATGPVLAAAWRSLLADDPGIFAPVAGHPATVRALVSAHRELRDADEKGLAAIARHGGPVQKDLVRLHRAVLERLHGFYDVADLRRTATAVLRAQSADAGSGPGHAQVRRGASSEVGAVVLFLPQDLPRDAADLVAAVAATGELRVVAGFTGVPRADAAVVRTLGRLGVRQPPVPAVTPALAGAVRHASDADDEVRVVVREVLTALRTTPAHRVAVLYGSAQPYARILAEQLDAAGLARSGAGVRPTVERTLPRLLLDLLALPAHGWRRDEVMSVIARATTRTADGGRLPATVWERMSREAGVVAGDDWATRLTHHAEAIEAALAADATDGHRRYVGYRMADALALRDFVLGLRAHLDQGAALTTWPELARWAQEAFTRIAGDAETALPEDEQRAAQRVRVTLDGLAGLHALEPRATVDTLRSALELELADDLPRHGRFGTGVLVAPLAESIGLDADVVFVVGLADDLVPGQVSSDALLDQDVRAAGGLRPLRERIDQAHRHLLAAFAGATTVVASFPRGDLRKSAARLPSRWLLPTLREHAGVPDIEAGRWERHDGTEHLQGSPSFAAALAMTDQLATEQEWRVRAAVAAVSTKDDRLRAVATALPGDTVVERAVDLVASRLSRVFTRFDGNLSGHPVPAPGTQRPTSPTALEGWTLCPHRYFIERLLGVEVLDPPEEILLARQLEVGSIVHESLDEFYRLHGQASPGPSRPWTTTQRAALHEIARQVAQTYTERGLTGHPVLWQRRLLTILHDLDVLLDQDTALRAETGRVQVRSELAFGMKGEPPVSLDLPSGLTIRVRGSADRVDQAGKALVVVDYKTGSDYSYRELSESNPTANGSKLQLPVYAKAARTALGDPETEVSAEYWFVGRSTSRIGVPLTEEVDSIFLGTIDTIASGITAGLFPQRPPHDDAFSFGCPSCDPDGLGAGEARRAWGAKRADPRLASYLALVEPEERA